jgi:filamentous hemagglutinin family protein
MCGVTHRKQLVEPIGIRRAFEKSMLGAVSLLALMVASDLGEARSLTPGTNTVAPTAAAVQAGIAAAQQAAGATMQAQASLARAAAALAAARKLQFDAAASAQTSSVPNGLTPGGLMPSGGTASDPLAGVRTNAEKWRNADLPTQSADGSRVRVDINQRDKKAILSWDTFNVGASTTVNFNQAASDWIALNRVTDPSAAPSRILGQINAQGAVYLINRNGIVFGAGSQVNVHTLVASSLDVGKLGTDLVGRDQYFLNTGIGNVDSFSIYDPVGGAPTTLVAGDIVVERGASITANVRNDLVALGSPGSVFLFGANVTNSGAIKAPTGEVGLVAARTVELVPDGYTVLPDAVLGKNASGDPLTLRGTEFRLSPFSSRYNPATGYAADNKYLTGTGAVTHDGLIDVSRGIVIMNGDRISVDNPADVNGGPLRDAAGNLVQGVISVDTAIGRNSMVLLRAATSVTMNGVISSLPFDDGSELPSGATAGSTVQSFTPAYIELSAQSTVAVGSSGLISAPSAQVAMRAIDLGSQNASEIYKSSGTTASNEPAFNRRLFNHGDTADVATNTPTASKAVLLAPGATIDVAGLANVELPVSYNFISFQPRAEFADMPLQRTGLLYGQTLWIDIRASGTRADGTKWVGTPVADASGYINKVGRSIYQLMTAGGSVTLKTDLTDNARVEGAAGSAINLAGGSVKFLPGMVNSTRLLGADGRIYSMANADPNMTYVGIAGQFTRSHERWGVKETWTTGSTIDVAGYTEGRDAGSLIVSTIKPLLNDVTIFFGSTAGERQIAEGKLPFQGLLDLTTPTSVQIGTAPSAHFTTPAAATTVLSAETLSGYGLSSFKVKADDFVLSSGSTLNLAPGGSLSVNTGGPIDIAGTIVAAGGAVTLSADKYGAANAVGALFASSVLVGDVFVGGTIDVSGRFVNDLGRTSGDAGGPGFINGGSISITTYKNSVGTSEGAIDTSGSILLAQGSVLDVSSGGYISPQGKPKLASDGVLAGKAGSISLAIYQGRNWAPNAQTPGPLRPTPGSAQPAVLQLDGTLLGYGFQSNGSLRLAGVNTVRVGGALLGDERSSIRIGGAPSTLPVSLLNGGGFGSYIIESVADDWSGAFANIIVSTGVNLTLQQQNLSSLAGYLATPTGTKLGREYPQLALVPDDQRKPVDLTLKADNILLDTGATIATDPRAKLTFGAVASDETNRNLDVSNPLRTVPAASVELRGSIIDHGGTVFINAAKTHLASSAVIDLSGSFIANPPLAVQSRPAISGTYIAGGSFMVEAGMATATSLGKDSNGKDIVAYNFLSGPSYLVAETGAKVDVSGAAGFIEVAGARGATTSLWSWSDAGTVSAHVIGFAWGGEFAALGGRYIGANGAVQADSRAGGGTFMLGGNAISLRQNTTDVSAAVSAFRQGAGTAPSSLLVAADQLAQFDNAYLYAAGALGGAARIFTDLPGTLYGRELAQPVGYNTLTITGALDWTVANRLEIAAGSISAATGIDARLTGNYVLLTGGTATSSAGSNTLTVSGRTIDVEGAAFRGFGQVSLVSSGDLRLSTPKVVNNSTPNADGTVPQDLSRFNGSLRAAGDVLLSAQRIYPVSAVDFKIETPGNVTFAAPAGSNTATPLSAGGSLTVIAKNIDQGGNLFAPLGKIALGNSDASVSPITTQSVTLRPGSLTSVTLADTVVPYGVTIDGTNWYYNASLNSLAQPPSKGIVLAGADVIRSDGSVIDVRGGGDLQAAEWIQGQGGSRDTLTTTPSGQTVYALVPSRNDAVAAFDIHLSAARSSDAGKTVAPGDALPLAGSQITLDGGGGIPAGTYTLYPAHYATLPGAMRVVVSGENVGRNVKSGTTLPDSTVLVTGHFTQSSGKQSSGETLFAVQTNPVWQQYSEYSFARANRYFSGLAQKQDLPIPRLPMDAGRLAVVAQQSILLGGVALTQPGRDDDGNVGRGGELDISAPRLAAVGHAQSVSNDIPTGYVGLDVTQLSGFESILLGGLRSDTAGGTVITPTAANVLVDTRGDAFSAPEILMVAQQVGEWKEVRQTVTVGSGPNNTVVVNVPIYAPVAGTGTVTIKAGSVVETTGAVHAGFGRHYIVASDSQAPVTAESLAAALGGTLSGTEIINADLTKLPASWFGRGFGLPGNVVTNAAGQAALAYYANGGPQQPGRGALFVASNDPSLTLRGPAASGVSAPTLTIRFRDVTSADAAKVSTTNPVATGQVSGTLTLLGGDTTNSGQVSIEAGARISTDTLTVQATAKNHAIAIQSTDLHASELKLGAQTIGIGTSVPVADRGLLLASNSTQFANVGTLTLMALSGPVTVYGDFNPGTRNLTLDASGIALGAPSPDGSHSITASGTITLRNTVAPQFTGGPAATGNRLELSAEEIVLGSAPVNGNSVVSGMTVAGYSRVDLFASDRILIAGPGSLTFGVSNTDKVDLTVTTPSVLVAGATAANSRGFAVTSLAGNVSVVDTVARSGPVDRPADSTETGGSLEITASSVTVGSTIQAQAGSITLNAIAGNVTLNAGAYLAAGGAKKTLVDVDTYLAGGKVVLNADTQTDYLPPGPGLVVMNSGSVIDVAQAADPANPGAGLQGYGGEINVVATRGGAILAGDLRGGGGPGLGGLFKLDIKGSADLNALAGKLRDGGITGAIDIHTRTGNLELAAGRTLKANAVTLTADDATWPTQTDRSAPRYGQVIIAGTIDADGYSGFSADGSGQAGGQVGLFGRNAVVLTGTGRILARSTHSDERGGDVILGTAWSAADDGTNGTLVDAPRSMIDLQAGGLIDVSGGSRGGLSGGTVTLRAPLSGSNDVKIRNLDATITGARAVTVQGFVAFDTTAGGQGIDGSTLGWKGIVDPAGWFKPDGSVATNGSWTGINGWQPGPVSIFSLNNSFASLPPDAQVVQGQNRTAVARAVMGAARPVSGFTVQVSGPLSPNTQYTVTFATPPGGVAAVGTISTNASGQIVPTTLAIPAATAGRGYTTPPTSATINGLTATFTGLRMQLVSAQIVSLGSGYESGATPTVNFAGGGGNATLSFASGSGFTGQTTGGTFTADTTNFIPWRSSGVFDAFDPSKQGNAGVASFTGGAGSNRTFFATTLAQVTQGTWTYDGKSYGFTNLFDRLQPLVARLGADVVHVQPGIDLVNSNGAITVQTNWNLAAGTVGNLQTTTSGSQSIQYFDPSRSYVDFQYRLVTPWGGLDSGALTLRAAGDLNINASISDGFFQFGNYLDANYVTQVGNYLASNNRRIDQFETVRPGPYTYYLNKFDAAPIAPYLSAANDISPTSKDIATADLFPHALRVCTSDCRDANIKTVTAPSSWSYVFTAGANVSSANPTSRIALGSVNSGDRGDVIIDKHSSYTQTLKIDSGGTVGSTTVNLPTIVRTGTGNIAVAAARDVILKDTVAPGVIYAAGVNTERLVDPNYSLQTVDGVSRVVALNPEGFFEPRLLAYGNNALNFGASELYYGPPTAAAFPEKGGDVTIDAQRDVIGNTIIDKKVLQYYQPWLLSSASVTPAGVASAASVQLFGAGVFAPSGTQIASQTAWWIQYGSFQQGILSAGGNVTVTAGRDLKDVSVSLPTTGRASGGLAANSTPVTHLYGSGNMAVRAGRDILGGSFYEGSGHGTIMAGGSIGQNGTVARFKSSFALADVPLLALDTGQIAMVARGALAMAGVVNPAALHAQQPSAANPLEANLALPSLPLYMDTYGPDSRVRLTAERGDLTITIAPTAVADLRGVAAAAAMYPASFEALALNGSLITTGISAIASNLLARIPMAGIVLSPSEHGTFVLAAQNDIDLTFGYPKALNGPFSSPRPFVTAGPSLLETAFDVFRPNSGFDGSFNGAVLAHENDAATGTDSVARIYAATGDIEATGTWGRKSTNEPSTTKGYQHIEINRPARVYAGRDIVDLNIIVQNIRTSDVSTIEAGRNITYTGFHNGGGLQVAGPGFLLVQAGGDIGPFLPGSHNNSVEALVQEGIASVGNSSDTPVGNAYISTSVTTSSVGIYNQALLGPRSNPRRNALLTGAAGTSRGADIITMFGTKFGVDYQAMIDAYVDPANPANVGHNYVTELHAFLAQIGKPASSNDAAAAFDAFKALPADLQRVFVDKVFFAELKAVGEARQQPRLAGETDKEFLTRIFAPAYQVINTMFPSRLGYTDNPLDLGVKPARLVSTGDLDLRHATIQTRLGGDVSIFGPGGNIIAGSLTAEPNPNLKLRDIGILTLGDGDIKTFTDQSVLVNSSRVLTTQGGDVLMFSANLNLDAGRGSKTTLSAPALEVEFDQDDYQSIDLGGFVTGAGIATLQTSKAARSSNLFLSAPRGEINLGSAGIRSSGNIVLVAPVITNVSNIQAQGNVTGAPVIAVPNVGALTSGSNTAGAASKSSDPPTASGTQQRASVFIVEVVGYGGGEGESQPNGTRSDTKPSDEKKRDQDERTRDQ